MKGPLENIVAGSSLAVARSVCSLFSPLSPSLHLAPRALGLQAHDLLRRSWKDKAHRSKKENHPDGWFSFLCCLDKIDANLKRSIKTIALKIYENNSYYNDSKTYEFLYCYLLLEDCHIKQECASNGKSFRKGVIYSRGELCRI